MESARTLISLNVAKLLLEWPYFVKMKFKSEHVDEPKASLSAIKTKVDCCHPKTTQIFQV